MRTVGSVCFVLVAMTLVAFGQPTGVPTNPATPTLVDRRLGARGQVDRHHSDMLVTSALEGPQGVADHGDGLRSAAEGVSPALGLRRPDVTGNPKGTVVDAAIAVAASRGAPQASQTGIGVPEHPFAAPVADRPRVGDRLADASGDGVAVRARSIPADPGIGCRGEPGPADVLVVDLLPAGRS